jgi:hypothetical protein
MTFHGLVEEGSCRAVGQVAAPEVSTQDHDEGVVERIYDLNKLRALLSISSSPDVYCRSVLYFALTGRGEVWIAKHSSQYMVLLPHPNVSGTLLVFFPFASDAFSLLEHVRTLCKLGSFLTGFKHHFLARIPEFVAEEALRPSSHLHGDLCDKLERVDEEKLDWAYPSYDIDLPKLVDPRGGKLKTFRKKVRKFSHRDIEIIRPKDLEGSELRRAVRQVNKGWIRAKLGSGNSHQILGVRRRELMECYHALARLNSDSAIAIDGLLLKRRSDYVAFSFWERTKTSQVVPCLAALTCSYEKGLSEYLYYCIAKCLMSQGYHSMCIGGSETASLDQFKKKLDPINSHTLRTIRFSPPRWVTV